MYFHVCLPVRWGCFSSLFLHALPEVEPVQLLQLLYGGRGLCQASVQLLDHVPAVAHPWVTWVPRPSEMNGRRPRGERAHVKDNQMFPERSSSFTSASLKRYF